MKYLPEIQRILSGESLYAVSKEAGVNSNTIRRELIKHPDYAKAKAEGIIKKPGIPGRPEKLAQEALDSPAVAEVVAGGTTTAVAKKYGLPVASLNKMVRIAHPDFSLQHRGKTVSQVLDEKIRKLTAAKARAPQNTTNNPLVPTQ